MIELAAWVRGEEKAEETISVPLETVDWLLDIRVAAHRLLADAVELREGWTSDKTRAAKRALEKALGVNQHGKVRDR